MVKNYIDFLKEEKANFGKAPIDIECECEECHRTFAYRKRDSRWRSIRTRRRVLCRECSRHTAGVENHAKGVGNLNKTRREKALERKAQKAEKQTEDLQIETTSYTALKKAYENGALAAKFHCTDCGRDVVLSDRKRIRAYLSRNDDGLLCRGCRIARTKVDASKERVFRNTLDCTFAANQEYTGVYHGIPKAERPKYRFVCNTCGQEFEAPFSVGDESPTACPICHPMERHSSTGEKELRAFIEGVYPGKVITNDHTAIAPYELDVYLPEMNLAIEYDEVYWYSGSKRSFQKYNLCREKGIRLIMVYDFEWTGNRRKIEGYLRAQLGIIDHRIGARECECRQVDFRTAHRFLEDNHLQGSSPFVTNGHTKCFGLFYDGELVQLETFSKPRYNGKYDWELVRECSKIGWAVVGGKAKLLARFQAEYDGSILSYCDKRFFSGRSYEDLGFERLRDSAPNYRYFKNGRTIPRERCMKHRLNTLLENFDPNATETENMTNAGYLKPYDFGNFIFVKRKPTD